MKDSTADAGGLLLVDKPAGITSHAVVDRARRVFGQRRIGHAGTLDPFATGLLILLVGRATRLLPFIDSEPKVYRATIRFGTSTTTDDPDGEVLAEAPAPDQASVDRAVASLTGHLLQRPPHFSAKRVRGVRAYSAARRGVPLTLEPAAVTVYEWRILDRSDTDLDVEISCSGGTYIRALARDLGEAAGTVAHLAALRRIRSGRFSVEHAHTMDSLDSRSTSLLAPALAVAQLPRHTLDDLDARRVSHGQAVSASPASPAPRVPPVPPAHPAPSAHPQTSGEVVALCHEDELLAVAVREGESWRPKVVMRDG